MNFNWKKVLWAVVRTLATGFILGGILFIAILFASLMGLAPYLQHVLWVLGGTVLLAAVLISCGYLSTHAKHAVGIAVLCVALCCVGYAGAGLYRDSIPTVDESSSRTTMLWNYIPFDEENKLAVLDHESSLQFESPYAVSLDGATALYPIYAAFTQAVYPEQWEDSGVEIDYSPYNSTVECNGTIEAYNRLLKGEVQMIFAAGPSQAQLDAAYAAGKEFHMTPIGREAFVFFVNSKNPVTGLTVEQVQGIYSGSITNWKAVGGKNQKIRPFQRAEDSGSQTALQRLMGDIPLMEPEEEDRIAGMGGIIRQVANYRNYKNALGFSFRFYSTEMVQNGDIRLLPLNGIEPTRETIRNDTYPIASEFYAITCAPIGSPAPEETNPQIAAFLEWILSKEGQALLEETGYVGLNP